MSKENIEVWFPLGQLITTKKVINLVKLKEMVDAIQRHLKCDWGFVDDNEWENNNHAVNNGEQIRSIYFSSENVEFWIITNWNRSQTIISLPEEN